MDKPLIAVFSGPRSTVANNLALVTSRKGREPSETRPDGRFDHLVPQILDSPVTVRIQKFSAHPLEEDASEVYHDDGKSYYEVELRPEDGPYLLPYMARRSDGSSRGLPFEDMDSKNPDIGYGGRQSFFPDASRLFDDIDRGFGGRASDGGANMLDRIANYEFVRVLPPAGYTKKGEVAGKDFWPYSPRPIGKFLPMHTLARVANMVQAALSSGKFAGGIWLEGSPHLEETLYWLSLLIDTDLPLVGVSSQRTHGELSNDGDRNIVDAARYIASGRGSALGAVGIVDEQIFAARSFKKADARPGGYRATGGHGGVLGSTKPPVRIWFAPTYKKNATSDLTASKLPQAVEFQEFGDNASLISIPIKNDRGEILGDAIGPVHIVKYGHYMAEEDTDDPDVEVDIIARISRGTQQQADGSFKFHGFVLEAAAGSASALPSQTAALAIAALSGMPVVRVGRGDHEGPIDTAPTDLTIEGSNLDATKARVLLRAAMLKLGRLPKARDPRRPTEIERNATIKSIAAYQAIFDAH